MNDPNALYLRQRYFFELPKNSIAQKPMEPRDESRLMLVDRKTKSISHHSFLEFPELLPSGAVLVANNSKVIRARLLGTRILEEGLKKITGGKIEFFLLEKKSENTWSGLIKSSASIHKGFQFKCTHPTIPGEELLGEIVESYLDLKNGTVLAQFSEEPSRFGEIPLPPYLSKKPEQEDEKSYQTHFAKWEGSVAAPTAGLHFTPRIFQMLKEKKIDWEEVTLHVGLGTFRPVKVLDVREHPMHEERYFISEPAQKKLSEKVKAQLPLGAVGTTSLRVLESAWNGKDFCSGEGRTRLFLYPGGDNQINVVDFLLTNFHLPESTLFMLVCRFAGEELMKKAYQLAIEKNYRFFSYGDCMLIR